MRLMLIVILRIIIYGFISDYQRTETNKRVLIKDAKVCIKIVKYRVFITV